VALLKVVEFEEHFETDLSSDAIQRLLDAAEKQIIRRFGQHKVGQVDEMTGRTKFIFPSRPVATLTSIVETVDEDDTTLAADDSKLIHGGRMIERLSDGTNSRNIWGDRVKVSYDPEDEDDIRKEVQIDLVKLTIQWEGLKSKKAGNVSTGFGDYAKERDEILMRLRRGLAFV